MKRFFQPIQKEGSPFKKPTLSASSTDNDTHNPEASGDGSHRSPSSRSHSLSSWCRCYGISGCTYHHHKSSFHHMVLLHPKVGVNCGMQRVRGTRDWFLYAASGHRTIRESIRDDNSPLERRHRTPIRSPRPDEQVSTFYFMNPLSNCAPKSNLSNVRLQLCNAYTYSAAASSYTDIGC